MLYEYKLFHNTSEGSNVDPAPLAFLGMEIQVLRDVMLYRLANGYLRFH